MIGKGAQYLTAAGFGRYRITAASLGSLDLLDSLGWLRWATKQAIMDAFGVDGTAVIAATNEYLNGIAASDKAKATALAGFINEDPMMVCSLDIHPSMTSLSAMPIRFANTNGGWATSIIIATKEVVGKIRCLQLAYSATNSLMIGVPVWQGGNAFLLHSRQSGIHSYYHGGSTTNPVFSFGVLNSFELGKTYIKTNGVELPVENGTQYVGLNQNVQIGGMTDGHAQPLYVAEVWMDDGINEVWYFPIKRNGYIELIDVNTGNLVTRSKAFTEVFTLPDGTPWTPPTP